MELGSDFSSVEATVEVRKESNSRMGAQVDFASERGDSSVYPVIIKRSELVSCIEKCILVPVLTRSTQAGRSMKLFFLRYWAKASMKSLAGMSLTVKKVCYF